MSCNSYFSIDILVILKLDFPKCSESRHADLEAEEPVNRSHPSASRSPKSSGSPSPVGHHSLPYDKFVQQAVCQLIQCQKDASGTSYLILLRQMRFVSVHRYPCDLCTQCVFQKACAPLRLCISSTAPPSGMLRDFCTDVFVGIFTVYCLSNSG